MNHAPDRKTTGTLRRRPDIQPAARGNLGACGGVFGVQGGDHLHVTLGSASYALVKALNCPQLFAANKFSFLRKYYSPNVDIRQD